MEAGMIFNYVRVSCIHQQTDRQLLGVECDREFLEKVSGKDTNRDELQKLLMIIRDGDLINVHELSRLARNTQDLLGLVDQVLSKGASIRFHKENLFFDASKNNDAFQNLMLTMLGAISQFERDLMLERQREGIAIAKEKGKYKGRRSSFSENDLSTIRSEFNAGGNKADLARKWGISRGYLYQLASASLC
jgi:DNA invertase Pin-like site-specific DNA recombinase